MGVQVASQGGDAVAGAVDDVGNDVATLELVCRGNKLQDRQQRLRKTQRPQLQGLPRGSTGGVPRRQLPSGPQKGSWCLLWGWYYCLRMLLNCHPLLHLHHPLQQL